MDEDLKYVITEEERSRHDALFYSTNPKKGLLSGEQARSLFIRSRLPLSELSKIWKLADLTRDNMLDASEFATAMHLIQLRLRGFDIPEKLPPSLTPSNGNIINIPKITGKEMDIYQKTFEWKDKSKTGYIDTETACSIMLSSGLESHMLARIWDLSDIDRDTKLSATEFAIALHLLRYCKKGNELEGSIDVKSALPSEFLKDDGEAKKKRHTEVQTERRQLWTLKQKLCQEMSNGLDEKLVNDKIRPELSKVEEKLLVLEKEETELRRSLLNLKDKTKKESFKPFDRSFLLKKCVCGSDLFKGSRKSHLGKDSVLFEKLWSADQLDDDELSKYEDNNHTSKAVNGLSNDFTQTQPPDIIFTEVTRENKEEKDGKERIVDSVDDSVNSGYKLGPNIQLKSRNKENNDTEGTKGNKVERNESFSWASVQRRPIIQQSITEEVFNMPEKKDIVEETVSVEHKQRGAIASDLDEQLKLLEKDPSNHVDINQNSSSSIEHEVSVESVKRLESSNEGLDNLFNKLSDGHGALNGNDHGTLNGNDQGYQKQKVSNPKLPVGRVLSHEEEQELVKAGVIKRVQRDPHPRGEPTQEELLPMYIEEKRKAEEERRKKREEDQEKVLQAREELKKQDEETRQQLFMRKAAIQEAKGKLEKQISQTEHIVPTTDAGRLIEQELSEQRIRDEEARQRLGQFHRVSGDQPKPSDQGKVQPKQLNIESSPTTEIKTHFNAPVVRRQNPEQTTRNRSNRKSWVELEIEQQKLKDEEMKREREERQKEVNSFSQGNQQLHPIKRDIEMSGEPVVKSSSLKSVESKPTSQLFSKPPAKIAGTVPPRGVVKPNSRTPSNAPVVNTSMQAVSSLRDDVDGSMTADDVAIERKIQEVEERRRLEQIEKIRQESRIREAEDLVRQRNIREEELRKKRKLHLRETEKIRKEEQERNEELARNAEKRRLTFAAEKVKLEERVIRTMKENVSENTTRARTPSTSNGPAQRQPSPTPTPTTTPDEEEVLERRTSVRDAKAMFERPAATQQQSKVVMRQKRQSLNLDDTATVVKPNKTTNRASFYSDAVVSRESKRTNAIQIIGLDEHAPVEKPSHLVLGNLTSKRQQYETSQKSVEGEKSQSSSNIIQKEMQEVQRKEEELRWRRDGYSRAPSTKQDSVDGIKKNPLPGKMQAKATAPTLPASKQEPQQKSAPNKTPTVKKSFIEMEKEKERKREEALQRERQALMKEREMILMKKEAEQKASKTKDSGKKKPVSGGWQFK